MIPRLPAARAVVALLVLPGLLAAQGATSLTIAGDGRVLVRRAFPVAVPAGRSSPQVELGAHEPGSLFPLDADVQLVRSEADPDVTEGTALRRAVGARITFQRDKELVGAVLLGTEPERWLLDDGTVTFMRPGIARFPRELVPASPRMRLDLQAARARPTLDLGWLTDGGAWGASYQLVARGAEGRMQGQAVVRTALDVDDAEVQLLAGSIRRARPPVARRERAPMAMAMEAKVADEAGVAAEEAVGEAHLYTLPGRLTLRRGATTTVALFEPAAAAVSRTYTVRGRLAWSGYVEPREEEERVPVEVTWVVARPKGTAFGDRPLPAGAVRIFEPDAQQRLQLVGEAAIAHTAAGQELRLPAAEAFDLTARRTQKSFETRRERTPRGERTIATIALEVRIANATDAPRTVEVREERAGEWKVVASSLPAERPSATVARWRVPVPARGEAVLTYTVDASW